MHKYISARQVILVSFFVDLLDIIVNLIICLVTGSVIILSELIQGMSDLIASGLLLIGLKRPRSETYFWAFTSTLVMLFVASTLSFGFGLERFINPHEIKNINIAYITLILSIFTNAYAFWLSAKRILKKYKTFKNLIRGFRSPSFILTKNTFVLDLMGTSAAILGLLALILYHISGDSRFDGLGAMGIGLILATLSLMLALDIKNISLKKAKNIKL